MNMLEWLTWILFALFQMEPHTHEECDEDDEMIISDDTF
jgi:hypothetical protein